MSLASQRYSSGQTVFRWEPFLVFVSLSCKAPWAVPALLNFILLRQTSCLLKTSQELTGIFCVGLDTDYLNCLHVAFLLISVLREETDVKKKRGGVHKEKDMNLYFSLPASRKIFFYDLHEGFFFNEDCSHGYKPKCTVP